MNAQATFVSLDEANKIIDTLEATTPKPLTLKKLIGDMLLFAESQDVMTELARAAIEARAMLINNFKQAPAEWTWDKVKGEVKELIEASPIKDKTGALGAMKTCFEYRILPVTLNADRLRKLKSWSSWEGKPIANTYGKVHTKPGAGQKAKVEPPAQPNLPDASTIVPAALANAIVPPAAQTPVANAIAGQRVDKPVTVLPAAQKPATVQKPAGASAVPLSEVKPLTANVNGTDPDELSPFEHWGVMFDQFMRHGVTAHYVKALGHVLNVKPDALALAMGQARKDLMTQAEKLK
jgi:hypothetical protein